MLHKIPLFAQVNLDQSDEVTSNQEHKFMNKCRKPKTRASLTVSCMMQREGIQYNPSQCSTFCEGVSPPGRPSSPGTPCQSTAHEVTARNAGSSTSTSAWEEQHHHSMIAKIEKAFCQAFLFFFLSAFWERGWCFERHFLKARKSKTKINFHVLDYFFDFTS